MNQHSVLVLPYPPSVNSYWRHSRGRHYISNEGRAFRTEVWAESIRQRNGSPPIYGPVQVTVKARPPDARYRDIDNIHKGLCDALKHGRVYFDDSQIICLCSWWEEPIKGGRLIVDVRSVPTPTWWMNRENASMIRKAKREAARSNLV
jgi:crossover junction endodeoxyribonuclease RusA